MNQYQSQGQLLVVVLNKKYKSFRVFNLSAMATQNINHPRTEKEI
jgi:hypothetical protein